MPSTMELLEKALSMKRAAHWCDEFNVDLSTISKAKQRGRLSPTLAGNFAIKLGEDPAQWIAIAALEAEPESALLTTLKKTKGAWQYSCLLALSLFYKYFASRAANYRDRYLT